jgi:CubicO group peptidase (beta-lactamase class C family)
MELACSERVTLSGRLMFNTKTTTTLVALGPLYSIRRERRPRHQVLALLTALAALSVTGCNATRPDQAIRIGTANTSHTLCSGTFVSGLDPDQLFAESVKPSPGMGLVSWALHYQVDRGRRQVTTRVAGRFESRAVYRDGLGCLIVHGGELEVASPLATTTADAQATSPDLPEIAGPAVVESTDPALSAALDRAFSEPERPPHRGTKAVVVVHEGRVIAERYAPGYGLATAIAGNSATKSVVSALVGILVREGRIAVHQPAPVAAWQNPGDSRHAITIDQLLRMTAGFSNDERGFPPPATRMWFLEPDVAEFAAHRSIEAVPGSTWNYSNASYEILSRIVRDTVGGRAEDVLQFAQRELFTPLGMHSVTLEFDATGTPMGSKFMFASARDWARLGLLYLGDGVVGGHRILPEGWVHYSSSQTLTTGYGAGFWTNLSNAEIPALGIAWGMPGAPRDTYFARGYLGQYLVVVPSKRLVIARFGLSHSRGGDVESVGRLVADTIAALGKASR